MWFEQFEKEITNSFREFLIDWKEPINLSQLYAAVRSINPHTEGGLSVRREQTLTYLHTLLTEGKVKVQVMKYRPATNEEVDLLNKKSKELGRDYEMMSYGKASVYEWVRNYDKHNADACISAMRECWNNDPYGGVSFEATTFITLPENEFEFTPTEKWIPPT